MFNVTDAGAGPPVDFEGRRHPWEAALASREHAIDRVAKLEAVTLTRGAAPAEADFAGRRARVLIAQFGLGDNGSASASVDPPPSAPPVKADVATSLEDVFAAVVAYRHPAGDRRSKSALRFVELA